MRCGFLIASALLVNSMNICIPCGNAALQDHAKGTAYCIHISTRADDDGQLLTIMADLVLKLSLPAFLGSLTGNNIPMPKAMALASKL